MVEALGHTVRWDLPTSTMSTQLSGDRTVDALWLTIASRIYTDGNWEQLSNFTRIS